MTSFFVRFLGAIYPGHSDPLSLAIPPQAGAVSTVDGFGHRWGRNGEFCVAVSPVHRTAGILAYCMLAELDLALAGSEVKRD